MKLMVLATLLATLLPGLLTGCATSNAFRSDTAVLQKHPELIPFDGSPSPFKWEEMEGPDFGVLNGKWIGDKSSGVGIYDGGHPSFKPELGKAMTKGRLGVFEVEWHPSGTPEKPFAQECLVKYQTITRAFGERTSVYTIYRHVWAYSGTEDGVEENHRRSEPVDDVPKETGRFEAVKLLPQASTI